MMADRDTRPRLSPMPAHLLPIAKRYAPRIQGLLNQLYDDVMASSAERAPVELVNDALSLMAQSAALAGIHLTGRMAMEKGVAFQIAFPIALEDVIGRWEAMMASLPVSFVVRDPVQ